MQSINRVAQFFEDTLELIPEDEVTVARLVKVLQHSYLTAEGQCESSLLVTMENGFKLLVGILQTSPRCLLFSASFGLRSDAPEIDKLHLVNDLNCHAFRVRFSMRDAETLVADNMLPYVNGLPPRQFVSELRTFIESAVFNLRERDDANLVS